MIKVVNVYTGKKIGFKNLMNVKMIRNRKPRGKDGLKMW